MALTKHTLLRVSFVLSLFSGAFLKEIDSKSDLLEEESMSIPAEHRAYPDLDLSNDMSNTLVKKNVLSPHKQYEPSSNDIWPFGRTEATQIKTINVKCEKNLMKVNIVFDRPFHGLIFSKGHYSDPKCVHLPSGTGQLQANFEIYLGSCGMTSSEQSSSPSNSLGLYIENTIIIQYDPQVQEIWDQARKLRCTWYDFYEKAVTFRPFNVDMLDAVTANFLGDNIQCWMQIQVGKGPWASEVAGIVKIGQTMTMVLAIKDEENKFDMLVRNCIAHDGKHQPIQLVDEYGCIVRSKIMSKFQKVKNFGHSATVVSYAYFQAFKFPDSMNVHFQCVIQVCRFDCPQPTCENDASNDFALKDSSTSEDKKFLNRIGEISLTTASSNVRSGMNPTTPNSRLYFPASHLNARQNSSKSSSYTINSIGGMPRSLNLNKLRRRRDLNKQSKTDISTQKVIQVVAPGDVAFNLPLSNQDSQSKDVEKRFSENSNMICMPTRGFVAGLVLLVLLLLITCIITIFLVIRLKNIMHISKEKSVNYQCPKHPNSPCSCEIAVVQPQYYLQIQPGHLANIS